MDEQIKQCLQVLRAGGVILYPTDTIWGLGCDASNPEAVARIFAIKQRAESKSLVLLAANVDMVARYVRELPPMALQLIEVNDRPMTIVYPQAEASLLAPAVIAEDGSVGIRIPQMEFCQKLVFRLGHLLVSTSANRSGAPAPRSFAEIPAEIREAVDYVADPSLEAGSTGLASQIIKVEMDGRIQVIRG
ncbi:MAG: threonylcarbamoyl-AMP synthase [Bacteroidales bacterium]|nr:threonylcarbamoyl-AMP synthase [Bacteroidales bacterium]